MTVAGVSLETPDANRGWVRRLRLSYPLLTDRDRAAGRAFGFLRRVGIGGWGVELLRRATVLIDRDGQIAAVWDRVQGRGHAAQVREMARALVQDRPSPAG